MKYPIKLSAHMSRVSIALLVGVVAVPTAMTGFFRTVVDDSQPTVNIERKALNDAGRVRYIRRNYWRAVDIYNELTRLDYEGLVPPDINDMDSIDYYLDQSNLTESNEENVHASAPDEQEMEYVSAVSDAQHSYNILPEHWRSLLDGYVNTRFCAPTLNSYVARGYEDIQLYDLCVRLLDERIAAVAPNVLQRSAYLRGFNRVGVADHESLKTRLQNLEQSLMFEDGTSVRPRYHSGYRPHLERR